jgi:hypothetical protein
MTWVRLDDGWYDHPKFLNVGDAARLLWVQGLTWSARHTTDGHVSRKAAARFLQTKRNLGIAISELVRAGLWVATEDGYLIHDYSDYQTSSEQIKAERAANRERVRRWRDRQSNAVTSPITDLQCNGINNGLRGGARASAGLLSGFDLGGSKGADPATLDVATRIATEIRRHELFGSLDAAAIGRAHAERTITGGPRIEWMLRAIDECATKHIGLGLNAQALQSRLDGFIRNARKPRESNGADDTHRSGAYAPPLPDDPSEMEATRRASQERLARAARAKAEREAIEAKAKGGK